LMGVPVEGESLRPRVTECIHKKGGLTIISQQNLGFTKGMKWGHQGPNLWGGLTPGVFCKRWGLKIPEIYHRQLEGTEVYKGHFPKRKEQFGTGFCKRARESPKGKSGGSHGKIKRSEACAKNSRIRVSVSRSRF